MKSEFPKVDWRGGDKITIRLTAKEAVALNFQQGWLVDLSDQSRIEADAVKSAEASQAVLPDGWVAVPKEPTSEILLKAMCTFRDYGTMLAACPPCPILTESQVAARARREALEEAINLFAPELTLVGGHIENKIRTLIEKGDA